jgi:voltage-gated potassium channel
MPQKQNSQKTLEQIRDNIRYERVVLAAIGFIILGATFYHAVEKLSWLDAFYFTVMTIATVGYGDIAPKTAAGKVFTMLYILIGITIFVVLARIVISRLILLGKNNQKK